MKKSVVFIVVLAALALLLGYRYLVPGDAQLGKLIHAPATTSESLHYVIKLDDERIGSYDCTDESVNGSSFIRKTSSLEMATDGATVKSITTEIYERSDIAVPKMIHAEQKVDMPNLGTIKKNFDSLPFNIKQDLEDFGISISNDVRIKNGKIYPRYRKELINGKVVKSREPLNVPADLVSDLFEAGLVMTKGEDQEKVLRIYNATSNTFENYTVRYQGESTYKKKPVAVIGLVGDDFEGKALIENDEGTIGDIVYMEMPFEKGKNVSLHLEQ